MLGLASTLSWVGLIMRMVSLTACSVAGRVLAEPCWSSSWWWNSEQALGRAASVPLARQCLNPAVCVKLSWTWRGICLNRRNKSLCEGATCSVLGEEPGREGL